MNGKIDMHVHVCMEKGPERLRGDTWPTVDEVRRIYDAIGVEKGVAMPRMAPERSHDPITTRDAEQLSRRFPQTIGWWFCYMDPRMGTNSPADNLSYYLDYYRERGARGVGEIQANIPIDDPRYMNLFCHIEKSGLPVTIHFGVLGEGCGAADDPGLVRLERVLTAFPKLRVLGHASPFWAEISGDLKPGTQNGYNSGKIVKEGRLQALLRKHPNLYCDLSAGSGFNAISRDPEYARRFLREFHERLVFATDIRESGDKDAKMLKTGAILDELFHIGALDSEQYNNICRKNALRLLGEEA